MTITKTCVLKNSNCKFLTEFAISLTLEHSFIFNLKLTILYRKDFQRKELRDVTNRDFNEDTVILDESMSESYYKIPDFNTLMFLPAHLQELPPSPKEEVKDTLADDEESDELPIGDDLEEDEFYREDHEEIDFDDTIN